MKRSRLYQFDQFRLDTGKSVLWFEDEIVPLKPKALETLAALVRRGGEVITKDELMEEVWAEAFVEENNLSRNIHEIRKTLSKLSGESFIETVPRRGYRFTGKICEFEHENNEIVIERQFYEQTLIEEQEDFLSGEDTSDKFPENDAVRSPALLMNARRNSLRRYFAAALFPVLFLTGFFLWNYEDESRLSTVPVHLRNIKSIAILPLKHINETEDGKILSLGLTDALISRMGKLNRFVVRPLSAVDKFPESGKDALKFGEELKVDAVLTGTLMKTDNRQRINIRLFDVRDGAQIWTKNFDIDETDLFRIQDLISTEIARYLLLNLNNDEKTLLVKNSTENSEAYSMYLKGRYIWNRRGIWTEEHSPIPFYERAIALDPNFARAYLGLADTYAFSYETQSAEIALQKAIDLDPSLAEAYATRGFLRMFHYWDWQGAENAFRKSIELSPNNAKSHHWYGVYFSLTGQFEQALEEMRKAHELDPTSLIIMADIGQIHYFAGEYDKADEQLDQVIAIDPDFQQAHYYKFRLDLKKESRPDFFEKYVKAFLLPVNQVNEASEIFNSAGVDGILKYELNRQGCGTFSKDNSYLCAEIFNLLGEQQKALMQLEYSIKERSFQTPFIKVDPIWNDLREKDKFKKILGKISFQRALEEIKD